MSKNSDIHLGEASRIVAAGREESWPATVNPAISRSSTYLHENVASLRAAEKQRAEGRRNKVYGRRGTSTSFALEDLLTDMEGGFSSRVVSCGLAANVLVFQSFLQSGDHAIISDGVYAPARRYVDKVLGRHGIKYDFCRADASDLPDLITPDTRLVYLESPGSVLFEIPDIRRSASFAHAHGAVLAVDNSWGSALLHHPLALGADITVISATKHLSGHSDVLLGAVVANESRWPRVNEMAEWTGASVSPDDAYLVLRGMRTLKVRMAAQAATAERIIRWFQQQDFVDRIYYPALPDHKGHDLWRRDFCGSCGVFTVAFRNADMNTVAEFADSLSMFGIGSSWGGFESLVRPENPAELRRVQLVDGAPLLRFSIGLEDADDLLRDLVSAARAIWR